MGARKLQNITTEFNERLYKTELTPLRIACARALTGKILDVGGGLGAYLPYFGGDATVLDRSKEALSRLNYSDKVLADALDMPFENERFDNVWACGVCQYFPIEPFVKEALRVLKPGGKIYILVPNARSPWDRIKRLFKMRTWDQLEGIHKNYRVDELRAYGPVLGEIRFLPGEGLVRRFPRLGHTLLLTITKGSR